MALWDNYEAVDFQVVANLRGQFSVWPATRPLPPGWRAAGHRGPQQDCLEEIDRRSKDAPEPASRPRAAEFDTDERRAAPPAQGSFLIGARREVPDVSITALIRAQAIPRDRTAAQCGEKRVTRGELFDTAAAWARVLVQAGCGREVLVALLLPRGLDALSAILAVLEAGAAYVPLSCDDPAERTRSILEDCDAPLVVTTDAYASRLHGYSGNVLTLGQLRERAAQPQVASAPAATQASGEDLAFIFYTSGTTGEPKGVEGSHRQLVNYALWCREAFAHEPGEVTFLSASLFFLGSLTTIFTPLLAGWPIEIAPDGTSTDELVELADRTEGGLLKLTPTHIRMMMARGVPRRGLARQLMVGSEPLTFSRELSAWMTADARRVVVNHYGLTETHGCFCHWLTGREPIGGRIPIGKPIDNVDAYIVDRDGALVEVGEVGELLVGGPSLGRGYRGRPGLTAQRWIPNPWGADGDRLLRTGDLARLEPEGVVTVLGRADRQVKIRGHRVEPAALEEALRGLAGVKEALVLPRQDEGKVTLDAFLLRDDGAEIDPAAVRDELEARFPPPWIPARMAVLAEFPVNANGKVDVRALPQPKPLSRPTQPAVQVARWTRMDRVVADAFCDVLGLDDIGLADDFYDLGGDSLAAVEVATRVGQALGRDVPAPSAGASTVRTYGQSLSSEAQPSAVALTRSGE